MNIVTVCRHDLLRIKPKDMTSILVIATLICIFYSSTTASSPSSQTSCEDEIMSAARQLTSGKLKSDEFDVVSHLRIRSSYDGPELLCCDDNKEDTPSERQDTIMERLRGRKIKSKTYPYGTQQSQAIDDLLKDEKVTQTEAMCLKQFHSKYFRIMQDEEEMSDQCGYLNAHITQSPFSIPLTPLRFSLLSRTGHFVDVQREHDEMRDKGYVTRTLNVAEDDADDK